MYLSRFHFATIAQEEDFRFRIKRTCYDTLYPFGVLTKNKLCEIDFEPITVFYGGNGCGKTTALNVIAEKTGIERGTFYNRSSFFEEYLQLCGYDCEQEIPGESRIVTSDDVFDFMLNLRSLNENIDYRREELFREYTGEKYSRFRMKSLEDYEGLKRHLLVQRSSQSGYVRKKVMDNVREHSNGESAFMFFAEKIKENALYLLDEPENSLSPENQIELMNFIVDSARFWHCQFVIATHSPFLLSMKGAKIYDFDAEPVDVKRWTQLENVRFYYDFFKSHEGEFEA